MELPKKYFVLYKDSKGNSKQRFTNDITAAEKWEIKYKGTIYIDTRYKAKLRLYWYLWRKKRIQPYLEFI